MSVFETCVLFAILAVPAIGTVWFWRKVYGLHEKRRTNKYKEKFLERLCSPDFKVLETHLKTPLPNSLKSFYEDDLVKNGFDLKINDIEWSIAFFEPLGTDSLRESRMGSEQYVSIANDGCGNEYVFNLESKALLFHDHETGQLDHVIDTLDDFFVIVRESKPLEN